MCICLCDTCKSLDEQYRNMTYVELCCLEYHRFSPLSSDFANNNGNNIVWKTSYFYLDLPALRTSLLPPGSSEKTLQIEVEGEGEGEGTARAKYMIGSRRSARPLSDLFRPCSFFWPEN